MHEIRPELSPTLIKHLRPTQMTLGFSEVKEKVARFSAKSNSAKQEWIAMHQVPIVLGPQERPYLIDHHHLVRALHEYKQKEVLTYLVADLRHLSQGEFWTFMDLKAWTCCYDQHGVRHPFNKMPKSISALVDDPWRALANQLRRAGGCARDPTPFSEFLWADYLRRKKCKTLKDALAICREKDASHLPGWCGKN